MSKQKVCNKCKYISPSEANQKRGDWRVCLLANKRVIYMSYHPQLSRPNWCPLASISKDIIEEFVARITALLNKTIAETGENPYDSEEDTGGYINGLESAKIDLRILAKEFGVEDIK